VACGSHAASFLIPTPESSAVAACKKPGEHDNSATKLQEVSMVRPVLAATTVLAVLGSAQAQEAYKIGLVAPLTGPFTSTGKQVAAGAQFYLQQNGNTVGG
jgi:ABC-type branched-subunit amino acid transport system substrate-binding protein